MIVEKARVLNLLRKLKKLNFGQIYQKALRMI